MIKQRIFLVAFLTLILTVVSLAQPRNGEGRTEAQIKRLQEKVGLTDAQTVKIKEILQKARDEARKAFENGDGDRESMREMMMKSREKSDAEIMKLLTKEQKPKFEALRKEQQKEMQERMRERQ